MKVREILEIVAKDGWYVARRKGSHRILQHPTKPGNVLVAGNPGNDVPKALLHSILKQAGLEDER